MKSYNSQIYYSTHQSFVSPIPNPSQPNQLPVNLNNQVGQFSTFSPPIDNTSQPEQLPSINNQRGQFSSFPPPIDNTSQSGQLPSYKMQGGQFSTFPPPIDNTSQPKQLPSKKLVAQSEPVFAPPEHTYNGPVCYYHKNEPAVAQCSRCGKYICQDCFDSFGVKNDEEYSGKALCYDCTRDLVSENLELLKENKRIIKRTLIITGIGMTLGAIIGASFMNSQRGSANEVLISLFFGAMIGGSLSTFLSNLGKRITRSKDKSIEGVALGCLFGFFIEAFFSIFRTIKKIISYVNYLNKTSGFIKSDSEILHQMEEYMEYTMVRNINRGVDIETLLRNNSKLANNSVAQMARTQSEEQIEATMRKCLATINENGEIIRSFAA
ncbi:MAG: hypothetical protein IJI41_03125 [Anaerolineaceae bacterium]|nr:hypothetical protein [Anaerolineaceae bacterium]